MTRPMPGPPECTCIGRGSGCLTCLDAIGYDLEAICPTCPVHAGPSYSETKRLTDAECAAEFWRAYRDNEWGGHSLPDGYGLPNYYPAVPGRPARWILDPDMLEDCLNTWRRFAATPHALEES